MELDLHSIVVLVGRRTLRSLPRSKWTVPEGPDSLPPFASPIATAITATHRLVLCVDLRRPSSLLVLHCSLPRNVDSCPVSGLFNPVSPPALDLCCALCAFFSTANFLGAEVLLDFLCILCALCYAWDLASSITIA